MQKGKKAIFTHGILSIEECERWENGTVMKVITAALMLCIHAFYTPNRKTGVTCSGVPDLYNNV